MTSLLFLIARVLPLGQDFRPSLQPLPDSKPGYHLEYLSKRHVEGTFQETMSGAYNGWVCAGIPVPLHWRQANCTASITLDGSPVGFKLTEPGPLHQQALWEGFSSPGSVELTWKMSADIWPCRIVKGDAKPDQEPTPLSTDELAVFTRSDEWVNFDSPDIWAWFAENKEFLVRKAGESDLMFMYRAIDWWVHHVNYTDANWRHDFRAACQKMHGDCDVLCMGATGIARANGIPARQIAGLVPSDSGKPVFCHVLFQFYARHVGWVTVDVAGAQADVRNGTSWDWRFGWDDGNLLVTAVNTCTFFKALDGGNIITGLQKPFTSGKTSNERWLATVR